MVVEPADFIVTVEREVGRQGFVVGLLPSIVAADLTAGRAACIKMGADVD